MTRAEQIKKQMVKLLLENAHKIEHSNDPEKIGEHFSLMMYEMAKWADANPIDKSSEEFDRLFKILMRTEVQLSIALEALDKLKYPDTAPFLASCTCYTAVDKALAKIKEIK